MLVVDVAVDVAMVEMGAVVSMVAEVKVSV